MTTTDLMYKMAERAKFLADQRIDMLRIIIGGADTASGSIRENRFKTRGQMIEEILTDEFEDEAKTIDASED